GWCFSDRPIAADGENLVGVLVGVTPPLHALGKLGTAKLAHCIQNLRFVFRSRTPFFVQPPFLGAVASATASHQPVPMLQPTLACDRAIFPRDGTVIDRRFGFSSH